MLLQTQCTLCNGSHRLFKCDKFLKLQPQQRFNHAKQRRLCFNCLQSFDKDHACSKQVCHKCQNRHHTLLHLDSQTQAKNNGFPTRNNQSANTKGVTNANVNTYFEGQTEKSHSTSNSYCWNKKQIWPICSLSSIIRQWHSQSHFITDRCVQCLRLPRTQTHTSVQGIPNVNTSTGHSVSVHLRSRHTEWHTTLDCAILPNITGMTPATKLNTTDWKIPMDIKLADEHFYQPGNIDLLIGADLFYEMSRPGRRTRPGNYPVLQETVLGWTIAGRTPGKYTCEGGETCISPTRNQNSKAPSMWRTSSHTQPNTQGRSCGQTSNQDGIHWTQNFSLHCKPRNTYYCPQAGTRSKTEGPGPPLHEEAWRNKPQVSKIQREDWDILLSTTTSYLQGNKVHIKD